MPQRVAVPGSLSAGAALALLALDADGSLATALRPLGPATVLLYGTALVRWLRCRN